MRTLPAMALLPGMLCDAMLWRHQTEALRDIADVRVVDLTRQSSIVEMAEAVLAEMPERFAVAGLSMGGYVAFEVLRRAPRRVSAVAFLGTVAHPDAPEETSRRAALIAMQERRRFRGFTEPLLALMLHASRLADAGLVREITAMGERVGKAAFLRQQWAIQRRADSRPDLPAIACPVLALCGRQDGLAPLSAHAAIASAIPGARLEIIETCGHLSPLERPEAVTEALRRFLLAASPFSGPAAK